MVYMVFWRVENDYVANANTMPESLESIGYRKLYSVG